MACFQVQKGFEMSNRLPLGMAEATRLTSTGNLMEATALIQRLLQGGDIPEPVHSGSPTIIDVEPVILDEADPRPPPRPAARSATAEPAAAKPANAKPANAKPATAKPA